MSAERKVEELYPRAPRYEIELGDNEIVRFAHKPKGSKAMHTRIINLSESGMAFLVPYLTAPQQDEKIKVEFTGPNSESIACFAKVVRVQVHRTYHKARSPQTFKMVAVEFENMHPKQREMLSKGIQLQFRKKHAQYKREQLWLKIQWFFISIPVTFSKVLARLFPPKDGKNAAPMDENGKPQNYIDV